MKGQLGISQQFINIPKPNPGFPPIPKPVQIPYLISNPYIQELNFLY